MWRVTIALLAVPMLLYAAAPDWTTIFKQYEQQYGLPEGVLARIARAESNFQLSARNPGSSAFGPFQWLDTSWLHASRALYGRAVDLAKRADASVSAEVTAFTLAQAKTQLGPLIEVAKVDMSTGLYMSHFLGTGGARQFFTAMARDPAGSAAAVFPRAAAANRAIFFTNGRPRSFSEIIELMSKKLGIGSTAPVVPYTGPTTDTRGVPWSRSPDDVRPSDFVPDSRVPATETERDYPTTYTPSGAGVPASGLPGGAPSGNLLGGGQSTPVSTPYTPPPAPGTIQTSMLFGSSSIPTFIATGSPAYDILSIIVSSGEKSTSSKTLKLRDDIRTSTTINDTRVFVTPQRDVPSGVVVTETFTAPSTITMNETVTFLSRAIEALKSILSGLRR